MQIIKVDQRQDRESWLGLRRTVITGTKAKAVAPPIRGNNIPQGVFELLAEKVAIAKDGEPERDRGQRLEPEAIKLTAEKYNLKIATNQFWLSDDGKLGVSPDATEDSEQPTFAVEAKCLDTKNHLQAIIKDYEAKQQDNYSPIESLKFGTNDFRHQARQYFVINPNLERLYFTLHDDRVALENIITYTIIIERKQIQEQIQEQELYERAVVNQIKEMVKILKGIR
jgi:hypothetical protein